MLWRLSVRICSITACTCELSTVPQAVSQAWGLSVSGFLQATDPEVGTLLEQLGDAQGLGAFDAAVVRETRRSASILHSLCASERLMQVLVHTWM